MSDVMDVALGAQVPDDARPYASINSETGLVENISLWNGTDEWAPPEGYTAVQTDTAQIGWTYKDGTFSAPAPILPAPEEILATNQATQSSLLASASQAMTPLLVSLQLGDATDEETASAKLWQAYVRALKLVDLTVIDPAWPTIPA
jgi:hypothetical protein